MSNREGETREIRTERVARKLFRDAPDEQWDLRAETDRVLREKSDRWEFDFEKEVPYENAERYHWTRVKEDR